MNNRVIFLSIEILSYMCPTKILKKINSCLLAIARKDNFFFQNKNHFPMIDFFSKKVHNKRITKIMS